MFGLGTTELILILVIVMVLFGAKKLPALGEGLAKGIRSFRVNLADDSKEEGVVEAEKVEEKAKEETKSS
jgi:sec-independent protein translocase protein TatA